MIRFKRTNADGIVTFHSVPCLLVDEYRREHPTDKIMDHMAHRQGISLTTIRVDESGHHRNEWLDVK